MFCVRHLPKNFKPKTKPQFEMSVTLSSLLTLLYIVSYNLDHWIFILLLRLLPVHLSRFAYPILFTVNIFIIFHHQIYPVSHSTPLILDFIMHSHEFSNLDWILLDSLILAFQSCNLYTLKHKVVYKAVGEDELFSEISVQEVDVHFLQVAEMLIRYR